MAGNCSCNRVIEKASVSLCQATLYKFTMEDIRMVAMKAPYAQLKPELDAAFNAVMESMQFVDGPQVASFARQLEQYVQVHSATPCANGTVALRMALNALHLPVGAEVIVPTFTYFSLAEVVEQMGLKPVFADVLPDTFTLDPVAVEKGVSGATAAIIPVHLFGQCALMQPLMEIAQAHTLWVLEDATQAYGATYRRPGERSVRAGSLGHIGITSFFPPNPSGGNGEGGALFTNDPALAEELQQLSKQLSSGGESLGVTGLDTLQAAMLEVKIKHIDSFNKRREEVAQFYNDAFAETQLVQAPVCAPYISHVYQQYTIKVAPEIRDGLQEYLRENHIPSVVYYPQPLHLHDRFAYLGYKEGDFPVSEGLSKRVLSLPMHTELKADQLEYICHHMLTYVNRHA